MKITQNELEVLKAIDNSEYGDSLIDAIWTWSVFDNVAESISRKSLSGIISSLNKKGLVCSVQDGEDSSINMTQQGADEYINIIGKENISKWID